jgi:hypothetical protein
VFLLLVDLFCGEKMNKHVQQIRNRDMLLAWLDEHSPTATFRRSMQEGSVFNLGWFNPAPGSMWPGWIVRVVSRFKRESYAVVVADPQKFVYRSYTIEPEDIERKNYVGGKSELYRGDV